MPNVDLGTIAGAVAVDVSQLSTARAQVKASLSEIAANLRRLADASEESADRQKKASEKASAEREKQRDAKAAKKAADAIKHEQERINRAMQETAQQVRSSTNAISAALKQISASFGVGLALGGLLQFGKQAITAAADLEALQTASETVAGSAGETQRQLKELTEIAKLPGIGFEEAVKGSVRLQAAGFSAKQAADSIRNFGNAIASAGGGKAELEGVTLALSQIASKGKIFAEEINQIAERVPQIRTMMIEAFGTADGQVLQKAGLSVDEFLNKLNEVAERMPHVRDSLKNELETAADSIKKSLGKIGVALTPLTSMFLKTAVPAVEALAGGIKKVSEEIQRLAFISAVYAGGAKTQNGAMTPRQQLEAVTAEIAQFKKTMVQNRGIDATGPDALLFGKDVNAEYTKRFQNLIAMQKRLRAEVEGADEIERKRGTLGREKRDGATPINAAGRANAFDAIKAGMKDAPGEIDTMEGEIAKTTLGTFGKERSDANRDLKERLALVEKLRTAAGFLEKELTYATAAQKTQIAQAKQKAGEIAELARKDFAATMADIDKREKAAQTKAEKPKRQATKQEMSFGGAFALFDSLGKDYQKTIKSRQDEYKKLGSEAWQTEGKRLREERDRENNQFKYQIENRQIDLKDAVDVINAKIRHERRYSDEWIRLHEQRKAVETMQQRDLEADVAYDAEQERQFDQHQQAVDPAGYARKKKKEAAALEAKQQGLIVGDTNKNPYRFLSESMAANLNLANVSFANFGAGMKSVIGEIKKSFLDAVQEMIAKWLTFTVLKGVGAWAGPLGALGGAIGGSVLSGIFRAEGGPVRGGQPYVVGEKRPELFVPQTNGYIMPRVPAMQSLASSMQSRASGSVIHVHANLSNGYDVARLSRDLAWHTTQELRVSPTH